MTHSERTPAEIRGELRHPVIDFDGHTIEFLPALVDVLRDVGGPEVADKLVPRGQFGTTTNPTGERWWELTVEERARRGMVHPDWWVFPTKNTIDRATALVPKLMYERLDEIGLDFVTVYPTYGLTFVHLPDPDLRLPACRALNIFHAELFAPYRDRMTPVAVIPLHTPEEGIEELRYAVEVLGAKAIQVPGHLLRHYEGSADSPDTARFDPLGMDSDHDYDPFWAECVRLGVAPGFHSTGRWGSRRSPSSYVFNHVGHFAAANEMTCKALFLGGVAKRFPDLRFGFLESGVAWAVNLLEDLIAHWEKRNLAALENYRPTNIDTDLLAKLLHEYGNDSVRAAVADGNLGLLSFPHDPFITPRDEFEALGDTSPAEFVEIFQRSFCFGCEADDPMTQIAFGMIDGVRLNAALGSDISHFDVVDMLDVLPESYENVEKGWMTEDQFADFVFRNPARFYLETNPSYFDGTVIEPYLAELRTSPDTASTTRSA